MSDRPRNLNNSVNILFLIQVACFVIGFVDKDQGTIITLQFITWTVAGLISFMIFSLVISRVIRKAEIHPVSKIAISVNCIAVAIALYVHYSPALG